MSLSAADRAKLWLSIYTPFPAWSGVRKLLASASPVAIRADGKISRPPHAHAVVDVKLKDGTWRSLRLPIRLDETTISDETDIVEYRLRSIEACP
jgi:hypothetical protein